MPTASTWAWPEAAREERRDASLPRSLSHPREATEPAPKPRHRFEDGKQPFGRGEGGFQPGGVFQSWVDGIFTQSIKPEAFVIPKGKLKFEILPLPPAPLDMGDLTIRWGHTENNERYFFPPARTWKVVWNILTYVLFLAQESAAISRSFPLTFGACSVIYPTGWIPSQRQTTQVTDKAGSILSFAGILFLNFPQANSDANSSANLTQMHSPKFLKSSQIYVWWLRKLQEDGYTADIQAQRNLKYPVRVQLSQEIRLCFQSWWRHRTLVCP